MVLADMSYHFDRLIPVMDRVFNRKRGHFNWDGTDRRRDVLIYIHPLHHHAFDGHSGWGGGGGSIASYPLASRLFFQIITKPNIFLLILYYFHCNPTPLHQALKMLLILYGSHLYPYHTSTITNYDSLAS